MSQCSGVGYSPICICLPLLALRRQWSLSGTPVGIAGYTNLAVTQATQVDENGGWVDLKVHDCDQEPNT